MTHKIAIIGGSGLDSFSGFENSTPVKISTPYGDHASGVKQGSLHRIDCVFMPRHGKEHELPPHKVNYRANIHALKQLGVESIIAINVVGGISHGMAPKTWVVPDQIIDYTYSREQTYFDGRAYDDIFTEDKIVDHIDFSYPYSILLRKNLISILRKQKDNIIEYGVYGCTQGPRLETAAEITRLKKDGCDIVGMTAMPEAALARELAMDYVSICLVVNWAAGISNDILELDAIMQICHQEMEKLQKLLPDLCSSLAKTPLE